MNPVSGLHFQYERKELIKHNNLQQNISHNSFSSFCLLINEMYALPNKTQQKLIVKVRGGISQKLDNFSSTSASAVATSSSSNTKSSTTLNSSCTPTNLPTKLGNNDKIIGKSTGLSRHIINEAAFDAEFSHLPQPVFQTLNQHGNSKHKSHSSHNGHQRAQKQNISPEHNEMIKYVQQSWKGVERDYKKSVNNFINNTDINNSSSTDHLSASPHLKQKNQVSAMKKTATTSTPLLLSGSYLHTSVSKDPSGSRQDSFRPFDLEAFWGNRILKRLTEEL